MITITELKQQIKNYSDKDIQNLKRQYHPDRWIDHPLQNCALEIFKFLSNYNLPKEPIYSCDKFTLIEKIAEGSISDIFLCDNGSFIKCCLEARHNKYIEHEIQTLKVLETDQVFQKLIPKFFQQIEIDRCVGFQYDIETPVYPLSHWITLDPRHIVWIFKRLMLALHWCHSNGIVHGAITPDHILVNPRTHGVVLIDWAFSGKIGYKPKMVPSKECRPKDKEYTEETDIYMAACSLAPFVQNNKLLKQFFDSCLISDIRLRPKEAFVLHEEMKGLAFKMFGEPKFVELLP